MVHRKQHNAEAQPHVGGVLADSRKHHFRCATMGPFGQEVVLHKPEVFKAHLFGQPYLINDFPDPLVLRFRRCRSGDLNFVEHSKFHLLVSSCLVRP